MRPQMQCDFQSLPAKVARSGSSAESVAGKKRMFASNVRVFARSAYSLKAVVRRELEIYEQLLRRNDHDWIQKTQRAV